MNILNIKNLIVFLSIFSVAQSHADEKLIAGTVSCLAAWNEHCEDKKIISVPDRYHLCSHHITVSEKLGDANYQIVATDKKSITIYFRAKGNQDRLKPVGASIKLSVDLSGVKETESCEASDSTEKHAPAAPMITSSKIIEAPAESADSIPTSAPSPATAESVDAQINSHACACSQWLNWMKVEHCLTKEQRSDRPPCDSYQVTIQCVKSKEECRALQKDSCPQVAGLNQSTSQKRLFVENSPYCQK